MFTLRAGVAPPLAEGGRPVEDSTSNYKGAEDQVHDASVPVELWWEALGDHPAIEAEHGRRHAVPGTGRADARRDVPAARHPDLWPDGRILPDAWKVFYEGLPGGDVALQGAVIAALKEIVGPAAGWMQARYPRLAEHSPRLNDEDLRQAIRCALYSASGTPGSRSSGSVSAEDTHHHTCRQLWRLTRTLAPAEPVGVYPNPPAGPGPPGSRTANTRAFVRRSPSPPTTRSLAISSRGHPRGSWRWW